MSLSYLAELQSSLQHLDQLHLLNSPTGDLFSSAGAAERVAQSSGPKFGRTTTYFRHLPLLSRILVSFPGLFCFFSPLVLLNLRATVVCRSLAHHPPACVTVKARAAERSSGRPSMALSAPRSDNAFFPCHKADALLWQDNAGPI